MARDRFLQILRAEPEVRESLLAAIVICAVGLGIPLLLSWLWVLAVAIGARQGAARGPLLVCGHRFEEGRLSRDYRQRLDRAAQLLAEAGSDAEIWLLGGGLPSEAAMGREYLLRRHEVDPGRIQLDEASRESFENLRNARAMLARRALPPLVTVVSNRYHLARLRAYARQLGLVCGLHPAERFFLPRPRHLGRTFVEAAFLCWFATGRLYARLAGRQRLLARIR